MSLTYLERCVEAPMSPRFLPGSGQGCSLEASRPLDWSDAPWAWVLAGYAVGQEARDRRSEEHSLLPAWRRCQSPIPEQHTLATWLEGDWVAKLGP